MCKKKMREKLWKTILKDTSQVLQNCTEIQQKQHGRDRLCLMWIASGFIKVQTELHRKPSGLGDCQQQEALIDGRGLREPPPLLVILQTRRPTFLRKLTLPLTACHVRKETNRTLSTLVNYFTFWKTLKQNSQLPGSSLPSRRHCSPVKEDRENMRLWCTKHQGRGY